LGARNIDDLTVVYDADFGELRLQYQPNLITLADLPQNGRTIRSMSDHLGDVSHEVGHYILDKTYKNEKGSRVQIPSCGGLYHDSRTITNEQCAWSEGRATFASLLTYNNPINNPIVSNVIVNYESGKHDNRDFPTSNGAATEGWITASLWDIHDRVDETRDGSSYDRVDSQTQNLWNAFSNDRSNSGRTIALTINDFKNDWDAFGYTNIAPIFKLNHIAENTPTSVTTNISPSGTIFSDTFENLNQWTISGDKSWNVKIPEEEYVPSKPTTNTVAHADNCDDECIITARSDIDLSDASSATLTFWRFVDNSVDRDEGLKLEISVDSGNSWTQIGLWTERTGHDNDDWVRESIALNRYLQDDVKLRFTAISSSPSEDFQIDDVMIR